MNFILSCVEHEKSFITSEPGLSLDFTVHKNKVDYPVDL